MAFASGKWGAFYRRGASFNGGGSARSKSSAFSAPRKQFQDSPKQFETEVLQTAGLVAGQQRAQND
jgi:hypothetical protein